jgi:hypothetical protein
MTTEHTDDGALTPELEAIAAAADHRLKAEAGQDLSAIEQAERRVAEAASAAITAGARLGAIADAERAGEQRARQELSADLLRQVTRAAKKKRDADTEYEQAITHAGRPGLSATARSPAPPRFRTAPSARSSPAPPRPRTTATQPKQQSPESESGELAA